MTISLNQLAKRYQKHWVFQNFNYQFESGNRYAILGANGSGKSTLLRVIAGMQNATKGKASYIQNNKEINPDKVFQHISYAAPGMDIVEEMSLKEFLAFHFTFKPILPKLKVHDIIVFCGLEKVADQQIFEFSSGMKQRVKLAQAFFTQAPVLLIDEPCSNLDLQGVQLYQDWLHNFTNEKLVIIASNDEREYPNVKDIIAIEDYKTNSLNV